MSTQRANSFNQSLFDLLDVDPTAHKDEDFGSIFQNIAREMFHNCTLIVNGVPHRFTELEFYLNSGNHLDDFAHSDPLQKDNAIWYFHRMRGAYKGGSFKGLDVTFAKEGHYGGILIRGIQKLTPPRVTIDGPSLVVDHILNLCGADKIVDLVDRMDGRGACDLQNILHIAPATQTGTREIYSSARVGLTLKNYANNRQDYICRFYRFFTHPKETKKGKPLMVLSLHVAGKQEHEIHSITGTPKSTVTKYIEIYQQGRKMKADFFHSKVLSTDELCLLHGFTYSK